jgi:opacity protein-like surface antigen
MKKLVVLAAMLAAASLAASSAVAGPLRAVGFEAGYVSPDLSGIPDASGTWVAGAYLDFGLPMTNLCINPFVNYWTSSEGTGTSEMSFSDWAIGANLKFTIPTSAVRVQPFVAAGAAAHMLNVSQESLSLDEGDTKFGYQFGAGLKVGVSERASLVGSGWYSGVEDANNWSARAGLAFNL